MAPNMDDNPYKSPQTRGEAGPASYGFENFKRSVARIALALLLLPFALAFGLMFVVGLLEGDPYGLLASAVPGVFTAGLLWVISRIPR